MLIDPDYYCHRSVGRIQIDPMKSTKHFEPWWMLLLCDNEIPRYYSWFALRWGVPIQIGSRWGAHISAVKGEQPRNQAAWKKYDRQRVEFWYSSNIRWDNGQHAWLDVYSPELAGIRKELGLSEKMKMTYHLTIGRLDTPREFQPHLYDHPQQGI